MPTDEYLDETTSAAPECALERFERNESGRDLVVGDIHGMFPHLSALLAQLEFDESRDRLFSVGDLVDRGPASTEAVEGGADTEDSVHLAGLEAHRLSRVVPPPDWEDGSGEEGEGRHGTSEAF